MREALAQQQVRHAEQVQHEIQRVLHKVDAEGGCCALCLDAVKLKTSKLYFEKAAGIARQELHKLRLAWWNF